MAAAVLAGNLSVRLLNVQSIIGRGGEGREGVGSSISFEGEE